jgi:hypothetical protein
MHFVPEDGIYSFFRYNENEAVMVVLNKNSEEKRFQRSVSVKLQKVILQERKSLPLPIFLTFLK